MRFLPTLLGGSADDRRRSAATEVARQETKVLRDRMARAESNGEIERLMAGSYYATPGVPYQQNWDVERMVRDGYERVIWVWRGVDAIARRASTLRIRCVEESTIDSHDKRFVEDPLLRLLNLRANQHERARGFRYRLSSLQLLSKKGVPVEVVRSRGGGPATLALLPLDRTMPIPGRTWWNSQTGMWEQPNTLDGWEVRLPNGNVWTLPPYVHGDDAPNSVLWVRLEHPTDPLSGTTPLEAAGISIDLDFWSQLYNRNFMKADGRPGGLLALKGNVPPATAEELRSRFGGGVSQAGRTSVISAESVSWIDTATTPRDAQHVETRRLTKSDILEALGVSETVLGNATGKTYDNADAERAVFWEDTMLPHLGLLESNLEVLTSGGDDDDKRLWHDVSGVHELQVAQELRKAKLREEVTAGLLTVDEYRIETGRQPLDTPGSRVLWIEAGRVPIGADDKDQKAAADLQAVGSVSVYEGRTAGAKPPAAPVPPAPVAADGRPRLSLVKSLPAGGGHAGSGVMVALKLDDQLAAELAVPNGEPADNLHVTLAFLGAVDDMSDGELDDLRAAVAEVAATADSLVGRVGGVGAFTPSESSDGQTPIYASVDVPGLAELRTRLVTRLVADGFPVRREHDFTPHVTLAYVAEGEAWPSVSHVGGQQLTFDVVWTVAGPDWDGAPLGGGRLHTKVGIRERQPNGGWIWQGRPGGPSEVNVDVDPSAGLRALAEADFARIRSVDRFVGEEAQPRRRVTTDRVGRPSYELTARQLAQLQSASDPKLQAVAEADAPMTPAQMREVGAFLGGRARSVLERRAEQTEAARVAQEPRPRPAADEPEGRVSDRALERLGREAATIDLADEVTPYTRGTPEVRGRAVREQEEGQRASEQRRAAMSAAMEAGRVQELADRVRAELGERPTSEQLDTTVPAVWERMTQADAPAAAPEPELAPASTAVDDGPVSLDGPWGDFDATDLLKSGTELPDPESMVGTMVWAGFGIGGSIEPAEVVGVGETWHQGRKVPAPLLMPVNETWHQGRKVPAPLLMPVNESTRRVYRDQIARDGGLVRLNDVLPMPTALQPKGGRLPERTLAATQGARMSLDDLGFTAQEQRDLRRIIKKSALTLDTKRSVESDDGPPPEMRYMIAQRHRAMHAIAAKHGMSHDEANEAISKLDDVWDRWRLTGGRSDSRDEFEVAILKLRNGGTAETPLEKALLLQKAWTETTWRERYGDDEVEIVRFVQNEYAARLAAAEQLREETGEDWEVTTWGATSWGVPDAAQRIHRNWVQGAWAVKLTSTVNVDDVWSSLWGDAAFRTWGLKAPGEVVVENQKTLSPATGLKIEVLGSEGNDRGAGDLVRGYKRVVSEDPSLTIDEVAAATVAFGEGSVADWLKTPAVARALSSREPFQIPYVEKRRLQELERERRREAGEDAYWPPIDEFELADFSAHLETARWVKQRGWSFDELQQLRSLSDALGQDEWELAQRLEGRGYQFGTDTPEEARKWVAYFRDKVAKDVEQVRATLEAMGVDPDGVEILRPHEELVQEMDERYLRQAHPKEWVQ